MKCTPTDKPRVTYTTYIPKIKLSDLLLWNFSPSTSFPLPVICTVNSPIHLIRRYKWNKVLFILKAPGCGPLAAIEPCSQGTLLPPYALFLTAPSGFTGFLQRASCNTFAIRRALFITVRTFLPMRKFWTGNCSTFKFHNQVIILRFYCGLHNSLCLLFSSLQCREFKIPALNLIILFPLRKRNFRATEMLWLSFDTEELFFTKQTLLIWCLKIHPN